VQAELIKEQIKAVLGQQLEFEGHFDKVVEHMEEKMVAQLLEWVKECEARNIAPFPSSASPGILVFFFKPSVTNVRGILTKKKNSYFLSLFLDKHKYYDRERRKLGFA